MKVLKRNDRRFYIIETVIGVALTCVAAYGLGMNNTIQNVVDIASNYPDDEQWIDCLTNTGEKVRVRLHGITKR